MGTGETEDLFPSATPKELQKRSRKCAGERLEEVQKILATIPKLPHLAKLEEINKELVSINKRLEVLKKKIG